MAQSKNLFKGFHRQKQTGILGSLVCKLYGEGPPLFSIPLLAESGCYQHVRGLTAPNSSHPASLSKAPLLLVEAFPRCSRDTGFIRDACQVLPVVEPSGYASSFLIAASGVRMASKVVARKSALHGMGLFAARDLEAGERLIEYKGKRYGKRDSPDMEDDRITKFLRLSDGSGIDGSGWAALANHGCTPNCELLEEEDGDLPRAWLYTLRDVKKGEELVWDYRLDVPLREEAYADWPCACGSAECRGTMADTDAFSGADGG